MDAESADVEGQLCYGILHKGLKHLQILVSAEVLVQIFRDTEGWLYVLYFVVIGMVIAEYNTGNLENVI